MKTKIIVAALSGLVLLSACESTENANSDEQNASMKSAAGDDDTNTAKTANSPITSAAESDTGHIDQDIAEPNSDSAELPGIQDNDFNEESGHYEDDTTEADDQMMEEDAGGE